MKKLVLCGAVLAALAPAGPAIAGSHKPMVHCRAIGMANVVSHIAKRGISCDDARVVIRSVEAHAAQCKPYRQATIAPFRQCRVVPALSVGTRRFACRSRWLEAGDAKRWWRTSCSSAFGDRVVYRRDGNHVP